MNAYSEKKTMIVSSAARFVRESAQNMVKWVLCNPLRGTLVVLGIVLLLFSMNGSAYSLANQSPTSLSANEVWLQAGSTVPLDLVVNVSSDESSFVSFDVQTNSPIVVDGALHSIQTVFSLKRKVTLTAPFSMNEGTYFVTIYTHITHASTTQTYAQPITVHVSPPSSVVFQTSPNSTIPATVANVAFSTHDISLEIPQKETVSVSFQNTGSATDFLVRFASNPVYVNTFFSKSVFRMVEKNDVVSFNVEIETRPNTPIETIPLELEAYDYITGKSTYLGTITLHVKETYSIHSELEQSSYILEDGNTTQTFFTIENTAYNPISLVLQTNSPNVVLSTNTVTIPPLSTEKVPFILVDGEIDSSVVEKIYIYNSIVSQELSFVVSHLSSSTEMPVTTSPLEDPAITAFISGAVSPALGFAVLFLFLLFISSRFRRAVKDKIHRTLAPSPKNQPRDEETK